MDRLLRDLHLGIGRRIVAGVEIPIPQREAATRDVQPDPMSGQEDVARRLQIDRESIHSPRLHELRRGSFRDRPERCGSAFGLGYPGWQRVHNAGFRMVVTE